jgi:hypothetical protein
VAQIAWWARCPMDSPTHLVLDHYALYVPFGIILP